LPSPLLCQILKTVNQFPLTDDVEITVEANPGTLTPSYLNELKAHGANRISIGVQTTHPQLLTALDRAHTKEEYLQSYHNARAAGFDNINLDLMFALPGQTVDHWMETLREITALDPEHISAYSLTPPEGKEFPLANEYFDRELYHAARDFLNAAGYMHYELSNFAKPGKESRHNINCWKMRPYIGFGLNAHSFNGKARWNNTEDMEEYLTTSGTRKKNLSRLTVANLTEEEMILGLRLTQGIKPPPHYKDTITKLTAEGYLTHLENGNIALTAYGMDFANRVFVEFLL